MWLIPQEPRDTFDDLQDFQPILFSPVPKDVKSLKNQDKINF